MEKRLLVLLVLIFSVVTAEKILGEKARKEYMATIGDSITSGLFANYNLDDPPYPDELAYIAMVKSIAGRPNNVTDIIHESFKRYDMNWASGDNPNDAVYSHYERLKEIIPDLEKVDFAHTGDETWDLIPQTMRLFDEMDRRGYEPIYITILIGANDFCAAKLKDITTKKDFRNNVKKSLELIMQNTGETRVLVSSIPNVPALVRHANETVYGTPQYPFGVVTCNDIWSELAPVCKTGPVEKRPERQRILREQLQRYNEILEETVEAMATTFGERIRFSHSVYEYEIAREDLSFDCFHPSELGHAKLSNITWRDSFWY